MLRLSRGSWDSADDQWSRKLAIMSVFFCDAFHCFLVKRNIFKRLVSKLTIWERSSPGWCMCKTVTRFERSRRIVWVTQICICLSFKSKNCNHDPAWGFSDTSSFSHSWGKPSIHRGDQEIQTNRAPHAPHSCSFKYHQPSEPHLCGSLHYHPSIHPACWLSVSPETRAWRAVTPAYALCFHASLDSPESLRLMCISCVYTT